MAHQKILHGNIKNPTRGGSLMNLEELKQALESTELENKTDIIEGIVGLVNAEKQKGMDSTSKLKRDVETYRKYKKGFESLGYDGGDLEEWVSGISGKLESGSNSNDEVAKLRAQVAKLGEFQTKYEAERARNNRNAIVSKLNASLMTEAKKAKLYGQSHIIENAVLRDKFKMLDDGTILFVDNGSERPFEDGIKSILEENKDCLINYQQGGGGSSGGGQSGNKNRITEDQFNKMSPQERVSFFKGGGEISS